MTTRWPPSTPVAAAALLWMENRLLLLRPTYKPTWTLPGGCVEDMESPLAACLREVREETGLVRTSGRLCCVDYCSPRPDAGSGLRFVFDLGMLVASEELTLRLPADEIAEHRLVTADEALALLDVRQARRLSALLGCADSVPYLENGVPPRVA